MPLDAWLLLVVAVWLGLGLELAFIRAQHKRGYRATAGAGSPGRDTGAGPG